MSNGSYNCSVQVEWIGSKRIDLVFFHNYTLSRSKYYCWLGLFSKIIFVWGHWLKTVFADSRWSTIWDPQGSGICVNVGSPITSSQICTCYGALLRNCIHYSLHTFCVSCVYFIILIILVINEPVSLFWNNKYGQSEIYPSMLENQVSCLLCSKWLYIIKLEVLKMSTKVIKQRGRLV